MTIDIPNQEGTIGIPTHTTEDVLENDGPLFLSSHPDPITYDYEVAASQTLTAGQVVGFNGAGRLIPAVLGTTPAIGVMAIAITTDASTSYKGAKVYRGGHFNHKRLGWDATYNTEAKKINAFEGAPTPTSIKVGTAKTYTP